MNTLEDFAWDDAYDAGCEAYKPGENGEHAAAMYTDDPLLRGAFLYGWEFAELMRT